MTSTIDPPPGAGMLAYHTDTEWWGVISSVGQDSLSVLWLGTDTPTSVPRHAVTVHAELPSCDDATLRALGRAQLAVARVHASNDTRARSVIADYREQRAHERNEQHQRHERELAEPRQEHASTLERIREDVVDKYRGGGSICRNGLDDFLHRYGMNPFTRHVRATIDVDLSIDGDLACLPPDEVAHNYLAVTGEHPDVQVTSVPRVTAVDSH